MSSHLTLEEKMALYEKLQYESKIFSDLKLPMAKRMEAMRRFDALLQKAYGIGSP